MKKTREEILKELRGYKNFWKFDFSHYNMWCFRLNLKASDTKNLDKYKEFLRELESDI